MIRKIRSKDLGSAFAVSGTEFIFLDVTLPSGRPLKINIQTGRTDNYGREVVTVDATFSARAIVEHKRDMPQEFSLIVRMPKDE